MVGEASRYEGVDRRRITWSESATRMATHGKAIKAILLNRFETVEVSAS